MSDETEDEIDDREVYRPSHIPEDVWAAAKAEWCCDRQPEANVGQQRLLITCRAIVAERDRCAKIANAATFDEHALAQATEQGIGYHTAATLIASAIRSSHE
jgi:hypothetical protein